MPKGVFVRKSARVQKYCECGKAISFQSTRCVKCIPSGKDSPTWKNDMKNKVCTHCGETKELVPENFRPRADRPGKFYARCKECDSVFYKLDHKSRYKGSRKETLRTQNKIRYTKAIAERRAKYQALKQSPCTDCGVQYAPHIMQFDHVKGDKKFNVASRSLEYGSWDIILKEVEKCELVCANCHADRTYKRRQYLL